MIQFPSKVFLEVLLLKNSEPHTVYNFAPLLYAVLLTLHLICAICAEKLTAQVFYCWIVLSR